LPFFDLDPVYPGRNHLERLGRVWGVTRAATIVDEADAAVAGWREAFRACDVHLPPMSSGSLRSMGS